MGISIVAGNADHHRSVSVTSASEARCGPGRRCFPTCNSPPPPTSRTYTVHASTRSHTHVPGGSGLGSHVVRRTADFPPLRRQWGPEAAPNLQPGRRGVGCLRVPIGTPPTFHHFHCTPPRTAQHIPISTATAVRLASCRKGDAKVATSTARLRTRVADMWIRHLACSMSVVSFLLHLRLCLRVRGGLDLE